MTWLATFGIAVLTAIVALFLSGFVATLAVGWYRISGFEGGAGYFVVGLGLVGGFVGLVTGIAVSRWMAGSVDPSFLKTLGTSIGFVSLVIGAVGATARLLADIPPTLDGSSLLLQVELRWAENDPTDPKALPSKARVHLRSIAGGYADTGPLWLHLTRREGNRWVVPGAVELSSSKAQRVIDFAFGDSSLVGFMVPLRRHPKQGDLEWTAWLPEPSSNGAQLTTFSYRYRVVRASDPMLVDTIGAFEVATNISSFYSVNSGDGSQLAASSAFRVTYRGQPVNGLDQANAVAVVAGSPPALVVRIEDSTSTAECRLVHEKNDQVVVTPMGSCYAYPLGVPLTGGNPAFHQARSNPSVPGWVDRTTFAESGSYLVGDMVLETISLTLRPVPDLEGLTLIPSVPPLGISPDHHSLVRFVYRDGSAEAPALAVLDLESDSVEAVPIDPLRMRFPNLEAIDPAWLAHHFDWKRSEGRDRLVERDDFSPIPYSGQISRSKDGSLSYRLEPSGPPLRAALAQWLVDQWAAERLPDEYDGLYWVVKIDGQLIRLTASESFDYVNVESHGKSPAPVIERLGQAFDRELATGKHDKLFHPMK